MRILMFWVSLLLVSSSKELNPRVSPVISLDPKPIKELKVETVPMILKVPERDISDLIHSMIQVESEGNPNAYAKREEAVGVLQIRPIMVNEVNRLLHKFDSDKFYTLEDRWSETKSIEMFYVIYNYYHKNSSYEEIARCWNGGPKGLQKKQTKRYWKKVQKELVKYESSVDRSRDV
tara:strand:- start:3438 stop:3968 length:531 start_codon:yes stop_codon:yes gene_type:complete